MTSHRLLGAGALALALLLSISVPATAQNLVGNPDFDANVHAAGWSFLDGLSVSWLSGDRNVCPASGKLEVVGVSTLSPEGGNYAGAAWSDCIPVPGGATSLWLAFDWSDNNLVRAGVVKFPDSGCADAPALSVSSVGGNFGLWNHFESAIDVTGSQSIRVDVGFSGAAFDSLSFDRVYLGVARRSFADDFDGGATCRWSPVAF